MHWSLPTQFINQKRVLIYATDVFGDFMSLLQDLIPEDIPSHKCHMNMGLILSCYEDMGI